MNGGGKVFVGLILCFIGIGLCLTCVGAIIGLPISLCGGWLFGRGMSEMNPRKPL